MSTTVAPREPSAAVLFFAARCLEGATIRAAFEEAWQAHLQATHPTLPETVRDAAAALRAYRQEYRLTQATMAELCGVVLATYQRWELEYRSPQLRQLARIRRVLAQPPAYHLPRKNTLEYQLVSALQALRDQCATYRVLAATLRRPATDIHDKCQALVQAGKLERRAAGVYALPRGGT